MGEEIKQSIVFNLTSKFMVLLENSNQFPGDQNDGGGHSEVGSHPWYLHFVCSFVEIFNIDALFLKQSCD